MKMKRMFVSQAQKRSQNEVEREIELAEKNHV